VARAFIVPESTMAPDELLPERVQAVLATVYLIFNEGYAASSGDARIRYELTREAIRLGRLLARPRCPC
jgi:RNA polymerase sigma-70 factor (ECF subfamily)